MTAYIRHRDAEQRIASAKAAIRAILDADLYKPHLKELLTICIWKLTLAEGKSKYKTRYRSTASLDQPTKSLNHEHVIETHKLVQHLIARPSQHDKIASRAIACVVTRQEHTQLTAISKLQPEVHGWDRYREAGIEVLDTKTGEHVPMA